jgi:hypothetical protein
MKLSKQMKKVLAELRSSEAEAKARRKAFFAAHPDFDAYGECTVKVGNYTVEIRHDDESTNWLEEGDWPEGAGIDMSNHRDFRSPTYGHEMPVPLDDYLYWQAPRNKDDEEKDPEAWTYVQFEKNYHILPIYMYDHSGRAVNTTGFSCPWDSGLTGLIYIPKKTLISEGWRGIKKSWPAKVRDEIANHWLRSKVEELNNLMTGEIYGYSVEDKDGDHIDSCWGYYGEDGRVQAIEDALSAIEHQPQKEMKL